MAASGKAQANGRRAIFITGAASGIGLATAARRFARGGWFVGLADIDAFWLGTMGSGVSGLTLSRPLRLSGKPVTRLENMSATGSESLRNACYAVASGAYDSAMAIGVEKLKDS